MSIVRAFNLQGSMMKKGPADGKAGILVVPWWWLLYLNRDISLKNWNKIQEHKRHRVPALRTTYSITRSVAPTQTEDANSFTENHARQQDRPKCQFSWCQAKVCDQKSKSEK